MSKYYDQGEKHHLRDIKIQEMCIAQTCGNRLAESRQC